MPSSAAAPAPTPARAAEDASAVIAAALNVARDGADVVAAVELFAADLNSNGGVASTIVSSPARIAVARDAAAAARSPRPLAPVNHVRRSSSLLKRVRSPLPSNTPRPKRRALARSPLRAGARAMARVASSIASTAAVALPPTIQRSRPTPTFDPVASPAPPPTRTQSQPSSKTVKKKKYAMLGLTPKTAFLDFLRASTMGSGAVSPATIKRETNRCRDAIFHRFGDKLTGARAGRHAGPEEESGARITRSSLPDEPEDWVVDMDAADCNVTDVRRLDRYCLEHIFSLAEKKNLLLLVCVDDDHALLRGKGAAAHEQQGNELVVLGGRRYYRLQCSISDTRDNVLVTGGPASNMYKQSEFEDDFALGRKGFQVKYHQTNLVLHFTWKNIMANPMSVMFLGPPPLILVVI